MHPFLTESSPLPLPAVEICYFRASSEWDLAYAPIRKPWVNHTCIVQYPNILAIINIIIVINLILNPIFVIFQNRVLV